MPITSFGTHGWQYVTAETILPIIQLFRIAEAGQFEALMYWPLEGCYHRHVITNAHTLEEAQAVAVAVYRTM